MEHQDFSVVVIGKKMPAKKEIRPKSNVDLHSIKLENENENFKILTIPKSISLQITQTRNLKKITQKEMAQKMGIQSNIYVQLENGKAIYDGRTKQLINKFEKVLNVKINRNS
tara:strand:- start:151 stop:489 length:339 start_codon:yes stop_codon:yes gene_type:complete